MGVASRSLWVPNCARTCRRDVATVKALLWPSTIARDVSYDGSQQEKRRGHTSIDHTRVDGYRRQAGNGGDNLADVMY